MVEKPLTRKARKWSNRKEPARRPPPAPPPASHFLHFSTSTVPPPPNYLLKIWVSQWVGLIRAKPTWSSFLWNTDTPRGVLNCLLHGCQPSPVKIQDSPSRYGQNPQSIREKRISQRYKVTTSLLRISQTLEYRLTGGRLLVNVLLKRHHAMQYSIKMVQIGKPETVPSNEMNEKTVWVAIRSPHFCKDLSPPV